MGFFQRLFAALLPKATMDALEAGSRDWMVKCKCGHERSVWELGGIKYGGKAVGKRTLLRCEKCGKRTWHRWHQKSAGQPPT